MMMMMMMKVERWERIAHDGVDTIICVVHAWLMDTNVIPLSPPCFAFLRHAFPISIVALIPPPVFLALQGWWDHRPITGGFIRLYLMPHGAVTCIAQLYVTYKKSGKTRVLLPTGHSSSGWQVAKGHLRESSLFSGEYIDLQSMASFRGWDTREGWGDGVADDASSAPSIHSWVEPLPYKSDTTLESWRTALHLRSTAKKTNVRTNNVPEHTLSPIGRLVPSEIPPVMPVERVDPDEVYSLGQGRWMVDFGKGFSGMVRFQNGLPEPIVPEDGNYPRGHSMNTLDPDESYITVVYGDSIEPSTGDINIAGERG